MYDCESEGSHLNLVKYSFNCVKIMNGINAIFSTDLTRLLATVGHLLNCHHLICFGISGLKGAKNILHQ